MAKALFHTLIATIIVLLTSSAFGHGLVHEQIDAVSEQLEQHGDDAKRYIRRGRLYIEDERYRLANNDFKRALKVDENAVDAFYYLADVALKRGESALAVKYADTFLEKLPVDSSARMRGYHMRGLAFMSKKQWQKAAESLNLTIAEATHPKPEYYLDLAKCYVNLGEPGTAVEALQAGIKERGNLAMFYDGIVDIYLANQRYNDAIATLDELISLGQRLPFVYLRKSNVLLMQGEKDKANNTLKLAKNSIESLPASRQNTPVLIELKKQILETQEKL